MRRDDYEFSAASREGDPQLDQPSGTFVQISAAEFNTCALRDDGTIACWGDDRSELSSPPQDLTNATQVSTGQFRACALRSDGTVTCWGEAPSIPPDLAEVAQVSIRQEGLCVLKHDTTIACYGTAGPRSDVIYPAADFSATPAAIPVGEEFTLALANAEVPDHPEATEFTYAFDCGDSSGYSDFGSSNTAVCLASDVGTRTVRGTVRDEDGDEIEYTAEVEITDAAPPVVTVIAPEDGAVYLLGQLVLADYSCDDEDSGVASCQGTVANGSPINTAAVGPASFTVSAQDNAGNEAIQAISYTVVYGFSGFDAPVSNSEMNRSKAGRTIPLKWRLLDANGDPSTTSSSVTLEVKSLPCTAGTTGDLVEESTPGGSGLQNLGDGYYQYNWKTPKSYAGSCKTLHLDLGEGLTRTARFQFTK